MGHRYAILGNVPTLLSGIPRSGRICERCLRPVDDKVTTMTPEPEQARAETA
jgi:hypothetical protein